MLPGRQYTTYAPPTMLPSVTGMRFFVNIWAMVISAPRKIPRGIMNMFAIEWSRPSATNALIGNQTAVILPVNIVKERTAGRGKSARKKRNAENAVYLQPSPGSLFKERTDHR